MELDPGDLIALGALALAGLTVVLSYRQRGQDRRQLLVDRADAREHEERTRRRENAEDAARALLSTLDEMVVEVGGWGTQPVFRLSGERMYPYGMAMRRTGIQIDHQEVRQRLEDWGWLVQTWDNGEQAATTGIRWTALNAIVASETRALLGAYLRGEPLPPVGPTLAKALGENAAHQAWIERQVTEDEAEPA